MEVIIRNNAFEGSSTVNLFQMTERADVVGYLTGNHPGSSQVWGIVLHVV
jgi:hypothetical protein